MLHCEWTGCNVMGWVRAVLASVLGLLLALAAAGCIGGPQTDPPLGDPGATRFGPTAAVPPHIGTPIAPPAGATDASMPSDAGMVQPSDSGADAADAETDAGTDAETDSAVDAPADGSRTDGNG